MNPTPPSLVERLLAERIGLDPSSVGAPLIARGVVARMTALGIRSHSEYERILIDQPDELQALVEEVVVPESWFFRDERPFEVLGRFLQPWLADPSRPTLTALSLPCASGEEPYSIAITLLEAGLPSDRFRVEAVDVSARSIARAIAGVYGSNAFRGMASARRSSYFREQNRAFTIDQAVRSTVRFRIGNLLDPTLFADRGPFDIVFSRNVLIYLDEDARSRAFASLNRLVAVDGLLFLGHADRLEFPANSPFEPLADKGCFAYRKSALAPSPLAGESPAAAVPPRPRKAAPPTVTGRVRPPQPSPPAPARKVVENPKAATTGHPTPLHPNPPPQGAREPDQGQEALLTRASALADSGRYDEASAAIAQALACGGATARAHFLLGMIAQASGLREAAEGHYLKAIYLDPQDDESLLALALLARRKGDVAAEATYRRRAERVLARKVVP